MAFRRSPDAEEINLIPLMNLFVTMIPLLLMSAAFYHLGMVSTSVPTVSEGESDAPTGKTSVSANVRITLKGYNLTTSSATLTPEELKAFDAFIPKKDGKYDHAALTGALERIKRKYEQSDTMMLIPEKGIKYKEMILAMDAARKMVLSSGAQTRKVNLFPVVVITTLVQ
ncbi:MAG: biopolymer transporter ExbD [Deltaproteobacteria bacterium]|nr:biopolymer transporter ExbD [Deltaproteobacteria bacterium]